MKIVKDKDNLITLLLFAQTLDNSSYSDILFRLMMELNFKWYSAVTLHELVKSQEEEIKKLRKNKKMNGRSYEPEMKQIAYVEAYLASIYALTERIAKITKIFFGNDKSQLKDGFHKQRDQLIKRPEINQDLSSLLMKQEWYDLFREVREEATHFGTSFLAWGVDKKTGSEFSQLVIEIGGRKKKKVLTSTRYFFDIREIDSFLKGISDYMKEWAGILVKRLDPQYQSLNIIKK